MQLVPVAQSDAITRNQFVSTTSSQPVPGSLHELQSQLSLWQPFQNGHHDPTWQEFLREQEKVEKDMVRMEQDMGNNLGGTLQRTRDSDWTDSPDVRNGAGSLHRGSSASSKEVLRAGQGGGSREVMTWPAPVIRQHRNGLTSFSLDVDVGDTYLPDEIHVNIVDGHVLHIHAKHRYLRRQVKDNTLSASRQLCEFDRRFALPDHKVKPENLSCLVSPEGILHIRGFLGEDVVQQRRVVTPESGRGSKDGKQRSRKVNFAVFGSKKSR